MESTETDGTAVQAVDGGTRLKWAPDDQKHGPRTWGELLEQWGGQDESFIPWRWQFLVLGVLCLLTGVCAMFLGLAMKTGIVGSGMLMIANGIAVLSMSRRGFRAVYLARNKQLRK